MKHRWRKNKKGEVDTYAWETDQHNGVICDACGETLCVLCDPDYMERDDCDGDQPFIEVEKVYVKKIKPDHETPLLADRDFVAMIAEELNMGRIDVGVILSWLNNNGYVSIKDTKEPSYWYRPPQELVEEAEVVE